MAIEILELEARVGANLSGFKAAMGVVKADAKAAAGTLGEITAAGIALSGGLTKIAPAAKAGFAVLTGDVTQLGKVFEAIPGPIGAAGKAIGDFVGNAADGYMKVVESARKLSEQTGGSVEFVSGFKEGAADLRIEADKVDLALRTLAKNLGGITDADTLAATGGKSLTAALKDQGIAASGVEETVYALADRIQQLGPSTEGAKLATQAFGKAGLDLLPVLQKGAAGVRELMEANQDLVVSMADVAKVNAYKMMADVNADANEQFNRSVGEAALPPLTRLNIAWSLMISGEKSWLDGQAVMQETERRYAKLLNDSATASEKLAAAQNARGAIEYDLLAPAQKLPGLLDMQAAALGRASEATIRYLDAQQRAARTQAPTFQEYGEDSQAQVDRQREIEGIIAGARGRDAAAVEAATQKERDYKQAIDDVTGAIGGQAAALDKKAKVQAGVELATGKLSLAEFENQRATAAVMSQYEKGRISYQETVGLLTQLAKGEITAGDAAILAGANHDAAGLKILQNAREVEQASGKAAGSTMQYADNVTVTTTAMRGMNTSMNDQAKATGANAGALSGLLAEQDRQKADMAALNKAYKDGSVGAGEYYSQKAALMTQEGQTTEAINKAKKATEGHSGAVQYATTIVDGNAKAFEGMREKVDAAKQKLGEMNTVLAGIPTAREIQLNINIAGYGQLLQAQQIMNNLGSYGGGGTPYGTPSSPGPGGSINGGPGGATGGGINGGPGGGPGSNSRSRGVTVPVAPTTQNITMNTVLDGQIIASSTFRHTVRLADVNGRREYE